MVSLRAIYEAAGTVRRRQYLNEVAVRCAPDVGFAIICEQHAAIYAPAGIPPINDGSVFGMSLKINDNLSPGVWRLCDGDGTLLYDCRAGTKLGAPPCIQAHPRASRVGTSPVAAAFSPWPAVRRIVARIAGRHTDG